MSSGFWPSKRAYPFSPGSEKPSGSIIKWDNTTPDGGKSLVVQIFGNPNNPSSIPIREIYFPVIPAAIDFYLAYQGVPTGVSPNYTTQNAGCEAVDFDGVAFLTLAYHSGAYSGTPIYVFVRSLPTGPFRVGPLGAAVTSVTATAPITSSGGSTPNIALTNPLALAFGGTGTPTPQLIAGTGITITGTPFNWTISVSGSGISNIVGVSPIVVTGGSGPTTTISLNTPLALNFGGTGYASPNLQVTGPGLAITGNIFQPSGVNAWEIQNTGVTSLLPFGAAGGQTGAVALESTDGSLQITNDNANNAVNLRVLNPIGFCIAVVAHLSPGSINGAGQTVTLPTLPSGTWYVEVIVHGFGLGKPADDAGCTGNTITLTGANWGYSVGDDIIQCQGTRTLYVAGVVAAGLNPSVTITGSGVTLNSGTSFISLGFKAVRIT
jgi:hypothetical protein